jgi:hypothetical protein
LDVLDRSFDDFIVFCGIHFIVCCHQLSGDVTRPDTLSCHPSSVGTSPYDIAFCKFAMKKVFPCYRYQISMYFLCDWFVRLFQLEALSLPLSPSVPVMDTQVQQPQPNATSNKRARVADQSGKHSQFSTNLEFLHLLVRMKAEQLPITDGKLFVAEKTDKIVDVWKVCMRIPHFSCSLTCCKGID